MTVTLFVAAWGAVVSTLVAASSGWRSLPYLTLEPAEGLDQMALVIVVHNPSRRQLQVTHIELNRRGDEEIQVASFRLPGAMTPEEAASEFYDRWHFPERPFLYVRPQSERRIVVRPIQPRTNATVYLYWHRHGPYALLPPRYRRVRMSVRITAERAEQLNESR